MSGFAERTHDGAPAELIGATVRFGAHTALHSLDLTLEPGRITALLGPNGAGKTTTIRLLLGLLAPTEGRVCLFGTDARDPRARTRIGALLQIAKVPETLRVSEHIDAFRAYYPAPLSRDELIGLAGLQGLERRMFGTLSGGEKQRLLFALALAGDPDLLFLDEPTVGMDVDTRRSFWTAVRALRSSGRAVLLTTHHLEEADVLADRIVVIHRGRVVADGTPADIKRIVPARRIRCRTALPHEHIAALPHVQSVQHEDAVTVIMTSAAERVTRALLADPTLHDLEIGGAGLEEAFIALTAPTGSVA